MPTLAELKASSPAYANIPDDEFARRVYQKHYAGQMSFDDFMAKAGGPSRPDFSNIQSGSTIGGKNKPILSQRARVAKARSEGEAAQSQAEYDRMNMGGSRTQQALIGAGDALTTLYRGPKQMATDQALRTAGTASMALRNLGFGGVSDIIDRNVGAPLLGASQSAREAEAQRRADTENMAGSIPAQAGKLGANVAATLGPAGLARGTTLAGVVLPTTIRGNAALGAAYGAAMPYVSEGEQLQNAGMGAAFGGGLAALPAAGRYASGLFGPKLSLAERRAGQIILDATGGEKPNIQPSTVPGAQRTLGEATLSPELMRIEDALRANPETSGVFQNIDTRNNAARVSALQGIAGTDADMAAAEAARDSTTSALRDRAFSQANANIQSAQRTRSLMAGAGMPDPVASLKSQISEIARGSGGRTAVRSALSDVTKALDESGGTPGGLYNVRQTIGDLLSGKAGSDKGYAKAASAELIKMRELIDAEMGRMAPDWKNYLTSYQDMSKPINRMQVGRELLDSGSAGIRDAATGLPRLTPGTFAKTGELDAMAQRATGFKKAKAADILTPEQIQLHGAIMDDLQRQFARSTNPAGGAHTAGRLGMFGSDAMNYSGKLMSLMKATPVLREGATMVNEAMSKRVRQALSDVFADPANADRILSALPKAERSAIERALLSFNRSAVPAVNRTNDTGSPLSEQQPFYPGVR